MSQITVEAVDIEICIVKENMPIVLTLTSWQSSDVAGNIALCVVKSYLLT